MTPAASGVGPGSALQPTVVAAIEDLELSARRVVEGLRTGGNRSPFHGYSTEFKQHRPYRAGDDLKYLDWKLYARSDRLYTRQFRDTTNVPVMLVLDASASMAYRHLKTSAPRDGSVGSAAGDAHDAMSKWRYAQVIAAALAYVASDQGNAVGLMAMSGAEVRFLSARGGAVHLRQVIAAIDSLDPAGQWEPPRMIDRAAQLMRRRGIVIVVSDLYDDEDGTSRALRRLARHGHDVSLLQVLSPGELDLGVTGQVEFVDVESGDRRLADANVIAPRYAQAVRAFVARWRGDALKAGIDHALLSTAQPPQRALRDWLQRRGGRHLTGHSHRPMAR